MSLKGKVALVTGASRGLGKGIALQLGEAGATVYITGRTLEDGDSPAPGSLRHTAKEIEARGGKAVPIACDHYNDADVAKVFEKIEKDEGRLDLLINNAYSAVTVFQDNFGRPFWEFPESVWDETNAVGLRNHYLCAVKAAKIMTKQKSGLIVNVSSPGGKTYIFTPAYGIGKAAVDRMAADCGIELKSHKVTFISLWPGPVKTELVQLSIDKRKAAAAAGAPPPKPASLETVGLGANATIHHAFGLGESTEFSGKCIVALYNDPKLLEKTGKIITTAAIGKEYGLKDLDGSVVEEIGATSKGSGSA
ncbi:Dehydrogenase/reductase SDR family member 1 [Hypsibius exemplaris]|uniref:Dehydrogenase/reductase SDR family member 1 n=1 Tax=Hypsibius exemplaris TaxID=2072580 RepID=A0A1W0X3B5_HYPEX|nr:Dehydrogenase/reductase SDR family member 1 [Hypsibius exemplaris]